MSIGDKFNNNRYCVLRKLGWGHFSTVWLAHDRHTDGLAALKIQKSATHYTEAARDEIDMLAEIRDNDADDSQCCCRLLDTFEHSGPHGRHVCMVFEVLGDNLLALIKHFRYRGIPLDVVRNITRHVLTGLDYLHTCAPPAACCAAAHSPALIAHLRRNRTTSCSTAQLTQRVVATGSSRSSTRTSNLKTSCSACPFSRVSGACRRSTRASTTWRPPSRPPRPPTSR